MDLYEYQAKDLFAAHGVPVLPGSVAESAEQARVVAEGIGGPVVVKAQVKTGGRGKAGGVRLAADAVEAEAKAAAILGMDIKGHRVRRVLVAAASEIAEEYYFSFLLDRANRTFLAMASAEGGVEIEQLAVERPEALARVPVDPLRGVDGDRAREIVRRARFPEAVVEEAAGVVVRLWETFVAEDATLVEVNPLVRDPEDRVIALDGKVTVDDNAAFRQPGHAGLVDERAEDPLEARAKAKDLNYVKLEGQVGIIGNGAGLVMSTLDVVAYAGQRYGGVAPANFLDIGGGASAEVMAAGLDVVLHDPDVRSVFVNVFGGITACDAVATGIVEALKILGDDTATHTAGAESAAATRGARSRPEASRARLRAANLPEAPSVHQDTARRRDRRPRAGGPQSKPLVVRLDGNNVEQGRRILAEAAHPLVTVVDTMDNAADKAAELAAAGA